MLMFVIKMVMKVKKVIILLFWLICNNVFIIMMLEIVLVIDIKGVWRVWVIFYIM